MMLELGASNYERIALVAAEIGNENLIIDMLTKNNQRNTLDLLLRIGFILGYNGHVASGIIIDPRFTGLGGYIDGAVEGNQISILRAVVNLDISIDILRLQEKYFL